MNWVPVLLNAAAGDQNLFLQALKNVFDPTTFGLVLLGTVLGMTIGALPGLTATMGVALLLPLTFGLDALSGLMVLLAVYFSAIYGGSVSAILLKTPGTPAAAVTAMDGHQMALKGEAGRAMSMSILSSVAGGLLSTMTLVLVAPQLAQVALQFRSPEYFALAFFGLSIITSLSSNNLVKGIIVGLFGILISMAGVDPINSVARFTFGSVNLLGGIEFIPVLIGIFAFSQVLSMCEEIFSGASDEEATVINHKLPSMGENLKDFWGQKWNILRSSLIGIFIGCVPGTGGDISAYVAYNETRRWSKHPEKLGTGVIEGVASPESANNGTTGGAMIPLLTLGIPGDSVTAIILGALVMQGVRPGPSLFNEQKELLYSIFAGMAVANILLLFVAFIGLRFFIKILTIKKTFLAPIILVLCIVGSFAIGNNIFDVWVMMIMGVIGYFMSKFNYPQSPLIIALILGPMAEAQFRRSLTLSNGNLNIFYTSPLFVIFTLIGLISLFFPILKTAFLYFKNSGTQGGAQ